MSDTAIALPKFDVFLTFRGLDTRHKFISFLYKELVRRNIRTFKDDKDLGSGRRISQELKRAVEESKFAVVVVSSNYAGSSWCLNELLNIMELENNNLITVLPIFYGVEPTQLRRQSGEVGEHFKKHEGREDPETVLSWRQAMIKLTDISGSCSSESEDDSNLVDKVADRISELMGDTTRSNGSNVDKTRIDESNVDTTRSNESNLVGINSEYISYTKKYISYSCISCNISVSL